MTPQTRGRKRAASVGSSPARRTRSASDAAARGRSASHDETTSTTPRSKRTQKLSSSEPKGDDKTLETSTTPLAVDTGTVIAKEASPTARPTASSSKEQHNNKSKQKSKAGKTKTTAASTKVPVKEQQLSPAKPAPTVDCAVHRLRHVNFHPKPVLCMAASNSSNLLAVSRASGSVSLHQTSPKLRTLAVVAGHPSAPLTSLCWLNCDSDTKQQKQQVLVGAARSDLNVVDFAHTNQVVAPTPCGGGGVFCLQRIGRNSNIVAAGCQDGAIRLFRLVVVDSSSNSSKYYYQLQPHSTIPSTGAAVLSLACWCPAASSLQSQSQQEDQDSNNNNMAGAVLFAGVADGTIRRYDCTDNSSSSGSSSSLQWKSTLRMTVECYGRSTPTRVWALQVTQDGTVVSGDSLGHVQFWDGNAGTLTASFDQNDHKADVLVVTVNADEQKVFASGVDSRIVCIERAADSSGGWIMTHAQRPHTHDVKAMAIVPKTKFKHSGGAAAVTTELLYTGGLDTKLCTYSVGDFGARRPRALYPWPSLKSPLALAKHARILTMLREDRVDLYELAARQPRQMTAPVLVPEEETLIGTVQVKGLSNLSCSTMSDDGRFLALSDSYSLLLFHLKIDGAIGARLMMPTKIAVELLPRSASIGALRFVSHQRLLVATTDGRVNIISIAAASDDQEDDASDPMDVVDEIAFCATVVQTLDPPKKATSDDSTESSLLPVHSVIASANGRWFATQRNNSSQQDGAIDLYRQVGDGTDFQYWWSLPSLGTSSVTAAAFLPSSDDDGSPKLSVACVDYATYVFDVMKRCLADWSEKAGFPVSGKLPTVLATRKDFPVRIGVNPGSPSVAMVVSCSRVDLISAGNLLPCAVLACRSLACHPRKNI